MLTPFYFQTRKPYYLKKLLKLNDIFKYSFNVKKQNNNKRRRERHDAKLKFNF